MRLKSLSIFSEEDGKEIRNVHFNEKGVSFILDTDSKIGKSGNSIGKSTFVKIIDLCLGANDNSKIYKDKETGDDETIKAFLSEKKINATLTIIDNNGIQHSFRRGFYNKAPFYIDGSKIKSLTSYKEKLRELIFKDCTNITFRNLIPFFIRLDASENKMFSYLDYTGVSDLDYREYYDYFLGVSKGGNRYELKKKIKSKEKDQDNILKRYKAKKMDDLSKLIQEKEEKILQLSASVKSNEVVTGFNNENKNSDLESHINQLTQEFSDVSSEIRVYEDKIAEEKENIGDIDKSALEMLYQDAKTALPKLKIVFSDFISFHNAMANNRIVRYKTIIDQLNKKIESVKADLAIAKKEYADKFIDYKYSINDVSNSKVDDLVTMKVDIEELKRDKDRYERDTKEIEALNKQIEQSKADDDELAKVQERINGYFKDITAKVLEDSISLKFNEKKFPISIESGNKGSGDKKALASCFVFSMIRLFEYFNRDLPQFMIQDSIERISEATLKNLFDYVNNSDIQYIIPVLRDKIKLVGIDEKRVVLELSHKEKLFKI